MLLAGIILTKMVTNSSKISRNAWKSGHRRTPFLGKGIFPWWVMTGFSARLVCLYNKLFGLTYSHLLINSRRPGAKTHITSGDPRAEEIIPIVSDSIYVIENNTVHVLCLCRAPSSRFQTSTTAITQRQHQQQQDVSRLMDNEQQPLSLNKGNFNY